MKTRTVLVGLGTGAILALAVALGVWIWRARQPVPVEPFNASQERGPVVAAADYRLSGPFSQENLTLWLIHGRSTLPEGNYLTLQEGLEQKKVVVHETGSVGELAIENRSEEEVYVQSGDIVKGGQQDRTFPYDFIAPPRSGQLPIASFCVEQGRWSKRGKESSEYFSSSHNNLVSNSLNHAVKSDRSRGAQSEVWRNVAQLQERLSKRLGESVQASESQSSLELTLENSRVQEAIGPYLEQLQSAPEGKPDVIGMVVAVNGRILSADIYASAALFRKLWPKMLASSAVEAFIEQPAGTASKPIGVEAVRAFLAEAEAGQLASEAVTERVFVLVLRTERHLLSDTCDRAHDNVVIHRNILAR
jgi:hypothetical protein